MHSTMRTIYVLLITGPLFASPLLSEEHVKSFSPASTKENTAKPKATKEKATKGKTAKSKAAKEKAAKEKAAKDKAAAEAAKLPKAGLVFPAGIKIDPVPAQPDTPYQQYLEAHKRYQAAVAAAK